MNTVEIGKAPCGCPLYDTGDGIAKVHGPECEFAPKKVKEEPKKK